MAPRRGQTGCSRPRVDAALFEDFLLAVRRIQATLGELVLTVQTRIRGCC